MRYASIRSMDISNGEGVGVALFVQGCHFHCHNCFNSETWDFNGGKEWNEKSKDVFLKLIDRPFIKRISFLGGEPLADENVDTVLDLIYEIKNKYPTKTIWLYTGFTWNHIMNRIYCVDDFDYITESYEEELNVQREKNIKLCDVLVEGQYVDSLRDVTLKWRGSSNQRVIDVQKTLVLHNGVFYPGGDVILWTE